MIEHDEPIDKSHDDFYPFGLQMPGRSNNSANPHDDQKFTGHFLEQEGDLGIYHAQARMYDPAIGRFLGVDSMRGDMPGWNPYHYTFNNPVRFVDPDGNMPECTSCGSFQTSFRNLSDFARQRQTYRSGLRTDGGHWHSANSRPEPNSWSGISHQKETTHSMKIENPEHAQELVNRDQSARNQISIFSGGLAAIATLKIPSASLFTGTATALGVNEFLGDQTAYQAGGEIIRTTTSQIHSSFVGENYLSKALQIRLFARLLPCHKNKILE